MTARRRIVVSSKKKVRQAPRSGRGTAEALFARVEGILEEARRRVLRAVNSEMVLAYWQIGRELVEHVQRGQARADYGEQVVEDLSQRLTKRFGRGFSTTNLRYFRAFYLAYADRVPQIRHIGCGESRRPGAPIRHKRGGVSQVLERAVGRKRNLGFSPVLGWSHYRTLMSVEHAGARRFYEIEAEEQGWSVEHLERQVGTQLFARLLKSRDQAGVLDLARRGQVLERPEDTLKSPYVLDFLDLPDGPQLHEADLEAAILGRIQQFLLELGKGFAFVARQKRVSVGGEEFFIDLACYNYLLKFHLLVDLKLGKLTHQDVGQMDTYVRIYDEQVRTESDGPTIGLILCTEKNEAIARYSVLRESRQLFAAKYVLCLPSVEELERELLRERARAEAACEAAAAYRAKGLTRALGPVRIETSSAAPDGVPSDVRRTAPKRSAP